MQHQLSEIDYSGIHQLIRIVTKWHKYDKIVTQNEQREKKCLNIVIKGMLWSNVS